MSPNPENYRRRYSQLRTERSSWEGPWRDIAALLLPRAGRFVTSDRNRGDLRNELILDEHGTRALRILAAGLMAGMTSPARPWFRLATSDISKMQNDNVKAWLHTVTELMRAIFARSNTYRALHGCYEELGAFGTAPSIIVPNYDNVIHHHPLTIGEYCLATNPDGMVDTMFREFDMTVLNAVRMFGIDNVSPHVKDRYQRSTGLDDWITVLHAIQPRDAYDYSLIDNKNMPFESVYMELNGRKDKNHILSESGFPEFPVVAPRWNTRGGDIYGDSPGMEARGSLTQLQHNQTAKGRVVEYGSNPPLQIPTAMRGHESDLLPGGVSYYDSYQPNSGIRNAFTVDLALPPLLEDIHDIRGRIDSTFFADLFLMISAIDRNDVTAREISAREEEKLLMLGPVLERLHNEFLGPKIEITFAYIVRAGILPPPPPELEGEDLKVEFISTLAQAQQSIGLGSLDRMIGVVGALAQLDSTVIDKLNRDEVVDHYSNILGVNPKLIIADDQVAFIRQERNAQQQQQQQAEQMTKALPAAAGAAQQLSQARTSEQNALTDVLRTVSGYS